MIANYAADTGQKAVFAVFYAFLVLCGAAQAAPGTLSEADARHLLTRTGFSPTHAQVLAITGQPTQAVVARIVREAAKATPPSTQPDFTTRAPVAFDRNSKTPDEIAADRRAQYAESLALKTWWMNEMLRTPTPLAERMTLFWHSHFATAQQKGIRSLAMWTQHQHLRRQAMGNFGELLHTLAKDPAMLVYLDGANSRKGAPNENFAREVMELFVLGEATQGGGYTERDVKEAARAFTGWSVERDDFSFTNRAQRHDTGVKQILGQTGPFTGDQVLDLLLAQPAAAQFISTKLWHEFVAPSADDPQSKGDLSRVAQSLRQSNFSIAPALETLLLSESFWADANRGVLVKSPIELVVGTLRQFEFKYTDATPFVLKAAQLGQNLLQPPNVKGWPGYTDWINATTLLERRRFTEGLFRSVEIVGESRAQPIAMAAGGRAADAGPARMLIAEFAQNADGSGSSPGQSLKLAAAAMGREGVTRVAQSMARLTFEPDAFLRSYQAHADREPSAQSKTLIERAVLAAPPTQPVPAGTVGVAYLRALSLDPAFQLK